jgi:hypothetical protein
MPRSLISALILAMSVALAAALVYGQVDGQAVFVTNTPSVPSPTPSPSQTPAPTLTPSFTPTMVPTATPTPNGPFSYPDGVNPLTGLLYPSDEAVARRNLIMKISNYPPVVRPQSAVNQADLVYEYEAEGGVTRFAGIYRANNPDHVGPVRSGRLMDLELMAMYSALLAYSGASEPVQDILLGSDMKFQLFSPSIGDNCDNAGLCRFPQDGLAFEHTLYADTNLIWQVATARNVNTGYKAFGFAFGEEPVAGDSGAVEDIYVSWWGSADARWQYDGATQRYLRFTDGVPHIDKAEDAQIWADNVVVIEVPHVERPDLFPEDANYWSLEIQLWDQGRALVFRDGLAYEGYWRRRNREPGSALQLIFGNNDPILLQPGRTWVSVVRGLGNVEISEEPVALPSPTPTPASAG